MPADFKQNVLPWNQELWQNLTTEDGRRNHALLFTGPVGLGKLDLAFALAHHVIAAQHAQSDKLFSAGSHPDLHVVLPEAIALEFQEGALMPQYAARYLETHGGKPRKNITIEQIRRLSEALTTHPHISKTRVIVIGHAEQLNRNAANALLKNLEEPPANTLFVLVTDEISKLMQTIRSRCSLVHFRTPNTEIARAWLVGQKTLPDHEVDTHLAMSGNQPLLALALYQEGYIENLKTVFSDVNGLWSQQRNVIDAANNWNKIGAMQSLQILQKLSADLVRCQASQSPKNVFFPVQLGWLQNSAGKLNTQRLHQFIDELSLAKTLLSSTVDELLVLETLACHVRALPS